MYDSPEFLIEEWLHNSERHIQLHQRVLEFQDCKLTSTEALTATFKFCAEKVSQLNLEEEYSVRSAHQVFPLTRHTQARTSAVKKLWAYCTTTTWP